LKQIYLIETYKINFSQRYYAVQQSRWQQLLTSEILTFILSSLLNILYNN